MANSRFLMMQIRLIQELIFAIYNRLPARQRYSLKKLLKSAGHSRSSLDGLIANRDAVGKKSIAQSLTHVQHLLQLSKIDSLHGRVTLDFGSGYVPTDAVALWLLGAERSYAMDYNAIADFGALKLALSGHSEEELVGLVRDAQQPQFAERLANLRNLERLSAEVLSKFGIVYVAPFDILNRRAPDTFDLIMSSSVLEHIADKDIRQMLRSLEDSLADRGTMVHQIHLEDHLDLRNDPANFLRMGTRYSDLEHDARGNRVLRKEWEDLFSTLSSCTSCAVEVGFMAADKVPERAELLPEFRHLAPEEVFVSYLVYVSQKQPSSSFSILS